MIEILTSAILIISYIIVYYLGNLNSVSGGRREKDKIKLNPQIIIKKIEMNDGRKFNIIRDDYLPGGTKQRVMDKVLSRPGCDEFVYAGPVFGYAQVAIAYVAAKLNKKATIFVETKSPLHPQTQMAKTYGAKIMEVGEKAILKDVQDAALKYIDNRPEICLIPFGLHTPEYINLLSRAITEAWKGPAPKRMWVAAGSSTLLNALYKSFPKTYFLAVQVGKTIWPDQLDQTRTKLFISDEKAWEEAKVQPPYPTVKTYDAKLWKYVLEYGENDDYVWNVAGGMI